MSEKIIVAEFKSSTKHIKLLKEIQKLAIYEVEIKYPETYADETKRGVFIESRAFGCLIDGSIAEHTAKRHFMECVEKDIK